LSLLYLPIRVESVYFNNTDITSEKICQDYINSSNKSRKVPFSDQRDGHHIRQKAYDKLTELAGDEEDTEALILEILRVHHPTLYHRIQTFDSLSENIHEAFTIYQSEVKNSKKLGARFASKLTEVLPTNESSRITNYSTSQINRAKQENKKEIKQVQPSAVKQRNQDSTEAEIEWFKKWTWTVAPRGSSNDSQRRLLWLTWTEAQIVKALTEAFLFHKNNLNSKTGLIVMDYSTIHETAKFKLKDLNFTLYYLETTHNRLVHQFHDYWSKSKKDYKYTTQAFTHLTNEEIFKRFENLIVWSDGGLKTKEILYYFSMIAQSIKKPILLNYFAPYHGHNVLIDFIVHFGTGKRMLKQAVGNGGVVKDEEQVIESFNKVKNTVKGVSFEEIKELPNVSKLPNSEADR